MKDDPVTSVNEEPRNPPQHLSLKSSNKGSLHSGRLPVSLASGPQTCLDRSTITSNSKESAEQSVMQHQQQQQLGSQPVVAHMVPVNIVNTPTGAVPVRPILYNSAGFGMHHSPCIPPQPYLIQGGSTASMQWGQHIIQNTPPMAVQANGPAPMAYYTMGNMCVPPYICHPNVCQTNTAMKPTYRNVSLKVPPLPESMPVSERLKIKQRMSQHQSLYGTKSQNKERTDSDQKQFWPPTGHNIKEMISPEDILQQVCAVSDILHTPAISNTSSVTRVTPTADSVNPDILMSAAMTPPSSESEVRWSYVEKDTSLLSYIYVVAFLSLENNTK